METLATVVAGAVGARTGARGSGGVAVRLPRLRWQPGATKRAGARPRCSRGPPVSDRRGRASAGAPPVLRREPWRGGGDRARDRAPAGRTRTSLAVCRPRVGGTGPLPIPARRDAASRPLPARRPAREREGADDDRVRLPRLDRAARAKP